MDPLLGKVVAASSGATLTALTMTPFDVVKTRLQTQVPNKPTPGALQTCSQPPHSTCSRNMSSLARRNISMAAYSSSSNPPPTTPFFRPSARPIPSDICVCLYDHGMVRSQKVTGFWDALFAVARYEGVRGLWKGLGTTLIIAVPSQSAYMLTYDQLLSKVMPHISPSPAITPLLAGITARTFVSSLASPLELLRTSLQSTPADPLRPHTLSSTLRATRLLVKTDGVKALYRGLGPTLWRDVPFSGIYWAGYEAWKKFFHRTTDLPIPVIAFASGAISGMTSALLTHPFDVTKTRRQALVLSQSGVPTSTFPFMKALIKTEGVGALFAGLTPRLAKIAPACGIMIASYEGVGRLLIKKVDDEE